MGYLSATILSWWPRKLNRNERTFNAIISIIYNILQNKMKDTALSYVETYLVQFVWNISNELV